MQPFNLNPQKSLRARDPSTEFDQKDNYYQGANKDDMDRLLKDLYKTKEEN